jgi:hypothetical protein
MIFAPFADKNKIPLETMAINEKELTKDRKSKKKENEKCCRSEIVGCSHRRSEIAARARRKLHEKSPV